MYGRPKGGGPQEIRGGPGRGGGNTAKPLHRAGGPHTHGEGAALPFIQQARQVFRNPSCESAGGALGGSYGGERCGRGPRTQFEIYLRRLPGPLSGRIRPIGHQDGAGSRPRGRWGTRGSTQFSVFRMPIQRVYRSPERGGTEHQSGMGERGPRVKRSWICPRPFPPGNKRAPRGLSGDGGTNRIEGMGFWKRGTPQSLTPKGRKLGGRRFERQRGPWAVATEGGRSVRRRGHWAVEIIGCEGRLSRGKGFPKTFMVLPCRGRVVQSSGPIPSGKGGEFLSSGGGRPGVREGGERLGQRGGSLLVGSRFGGETGPNQVPVQILRG